MPETFDPKLFFPYGESLKFDTQVTNMRGGAEKRRSRLANGKKVFDLNFSGVMLDADAAAIMDFHEARKGSLTAFNFIPPGTSTTYLCRFETDEINLRKVGKNKWSGGCRLIQVDS